MKAPGKIDWSTVQRLANPQGLKDLDKFLDALPINVGYNALIAAGISWMLAGGAVLFASMETDKISKLRAELLKVEALQPPVPKLEYIPIGQAQLDTVGKRIMATFKGTSVVASGGTVILSAQDEDFFPQFMAAISFLQNGGKNWRVRIDTMCVGRECATTKIGATFKVDAAMIAEPKKEMPEDVKAAAAKK